jgi:phage terminase large subunit GpA-like protein
MQPPLPDLPKGLPSAWLLDCEVFARSIRPEPDLTICQWADRHRVLSAEISAEPGPWRTDRVPYSREIMEVLSPNDPTSEVTLVAGTQVAKTEIGNNFLGFIIDWAPGPTMMVLPTSNTGKRSSKTRLARMIDSAPRLRAKISERARDRSNSAMMKDFPGGVLVIAGANSAAELKSMPVRYLFEDEIDEYPDDVDGQGPADELAEKRTDTYQARKKIYRASTPTEMSTSKVWRHYLRGDQRKFYVPCPHCEHAQVLVWDQFRWETRKVWEITLADTGEIQPVEPGTAGAVERDTGELVDVWYECAACEQRIDEHHKTQMLAAGRWIASAPNDGRQKSYHLPAFYSPLGWFSWRQAVQKRFEADKDPTGYLLKVWTNTVAGEPYAERGITVSANELKQRAGPYLLRKVPAGGLVLTAGADIQGNRIEVGVKAWGRGEESWLVDYQVIFGDTETDGVWQQLAEYLFETSFAHEWGAPMRITASAIDTGFRTQTVYAFVRRHWNRNVIAVKGQSRPGKAILGRPSDQDITHHGQIIKSGVKLWPLGVDTAKSRIYSRLALVDEVTKQAAGPGAMHFPLGLPDEYWDQLTAERLVTRYHHGYAKQVWEKDAGARNEALDIEVYAYAAALHAGVQRVNWDRVEAALRATAGDLFVAAEARDNQASGTEPPAVEKTPPAPAEPRNKPRVIRRTGGFVNKWKN